jgi:endonuclease/exonuclease/phosphatase family metal-dependent hydrolase
MRFLLSLLAMSFFTLSAGAAEPLRVMTFNIRYDNAADGDNAWPKRRDWVAQVIRDEKVDLLGVQEALGRQIKDLEERLKDYAWFGAGRDDGKEKGEYVPLFYKKERFEVLDKGHFWLSTTPHVPGSKSWDAAITRMVSWLKLKDKSSGKSLLVANTHFDHRGVEARVKSAELVLENLPKLSGDLPVILTGDFNSLPTSKTYTVLSGKDAVTTWLLSDSRRHSRTEPKGPDSTWNGFSRVMPEQQIDFIFTRGLKCEAHEIVLAEKDGKFASDHLPVVAELKVD